MGLTLAEIDLLLAGMILGFVLSLVFGSNVKRLVSGPAAIADYTKYQLVWETLAQRAFIDATREVVDDDEIREIVDRANVNVRKFDPPGDPIWRVERGTNRPVNDWMGGNR